MKGWSYSLGIKQKKTNNYNIPVVGKQITTFHGKKNNTGNRELWVTTKFLKNESHPSTWDQDKMNHICKLSLIQASIVKEKHNTSLLPQVRALGQFPDWIFEKYFRVEIIKWLAITYTEICKL